ncbi:S-adenosyl-L-methionine-dependent methyltransferase [Mollisia scopiformis]|uniref:S-adenosyl-L-methionine-dependent methyltransferase n=1 Tax=Mollisia scopiformis TaxID=149040 RepID=A0A132BDK8_MOLSC|nr:S-adenosyl-L-methionine-dependent methyltransferase [Mollisia scopiformis]KUJ10333.1 S-adenosyl-L-methionine-dependent methyltransferase [Mollisia scopiformis]
MANILDLAREVQAAAEDFSSGKTRDNLKLLRAIRNLNRIAESPVDRLRRVSYQPVQCAVVRLAVEMGLPHALVEGKTMTAAELAQKSGADHLLTVRVMRVLVAMDICDEIGEEHYESNPTTEALATPTWSGGMRYLFDTIVPTFDKLVAYYNEAGFESDKLLFEYALGQDLWSFLRTHPSLHKDFLDYMKGRKDGQPRWLDYFPVSTQVGDLDVSKHSVTLVDIGGNLGHDLKLFQERCPEIPGRLILMDLPETIAGNSDPLEGIEKIEYDFFTPQPIHDAKFYMFRAICHDWSDENCQKFLGNTVKAMKKGYSRLLINDQVLPNTGAELHPTMLDFTMMAYFNAMERTERQWRTLLDSVGLEIVKIWSFDGGGSEAVIEAMLKD